MFVPKPILSVCPQVLWEARLACNPNASTQRPPGHTSFPVGAHSILGNFVAYRSGLFRSQITQAPVHLFRSLSSLTHNSLKAFLLVPSSPPFSFGTDSPGSLRAAPACGALVLLGPFPPAPSTPLAARHLRLHPASPRPPRLPFPRPPRSLRLRAPRFPPSPAAAPLPQGPPPSPVSHLRAPRWPLAARPRPRAVSGRRGPVPQRLRLQPRPRPLRSQSRAEPCPASPPAPPGPRGRRRVRAPSPRGLPPRGAAWPGSRGAPPARSALCH